MKYNRLKWVVRLLFLTLLPAFVVSTSALAASTSPPSSPVKLIFIHHSCGGNWLADANTDAPYGLLGTALKNNNYFVSATNYGWEVAGVGDVGSNTDIPQWPAWFTGPDSTAIMAALYAETGQNFGDFGAWSRLASDPGGENRIVMFKSCYPNSDLYGNPGDSAYASPNDWEFSVANAKAVYNNLLTYFQAHQDKLFIVVTAPPQVLNEYYSSEQTPTARAANARAFNNWLVNDWLDGYGHDNVAVFDYFNVLSGVDNHHHWYNGAVQHVNNSSSNFPAYAGDEWDSHPNSTGQQKATSEFVPLLNYYYNRWQGDDPSPLVSPSMTFLSLLLLNN